MMALSAWELLDLAGALRNPWGELRLLRRLFDLEHPSAVPVAAPVPVPITRPALTRAA